MAGSSLIGALRVSLGLDTATFETGASAAEKRAEQLGKRVGDALRAPIGAATALKGAIVALGGAATAKALFDLGKRALDYASSLDEVSQQLGVTSKDLQEYRYAASQVGISQEEMDKSLQKLTQTMGKARAGAQQPVDAFKTLSNLIGKDILKSAETAGDAIPLIADALAKIPDPTKRAALELTLFGKAGQQLDTLLAGGGDAIDQMRQAARDLGIVLSEKEIQNADATADKISELQQVLSVHIAAAVADNAQSIYGFVDSIEKLLLKTPAAIGYLKQLYGQLQQAYGGFLQFEGNANVFAGNHLGGLLADRKGQVARGQAEAARGDAIVAEGKKNEMLGRGAQNPQTLEALANSAFNYIAAHRAQGGAGAGQTPADRAAADKAKAAAAKAQREAEQQARKEKADQRAYEQQLAQTRSEYLQAQEQLTPEIVLQTQLQKQELADDTAHAKERVDTDDRYNEQQKAALKLKIDEVASLKSQLIDQRERQQLAEQAFKAAQQDRDNQADYLKAQEGLATTAKQRLDIELKLLDIQHQSERQAQLDIINDTTNRYSADDKLQASRQLQHIDQVYPLQKASVIQQNQGPLGQYLDALPKSADEMNEALQKVAADGLGNLTDGIADAITGAKSLGSAFKNVANQIISDLARIAVEKTITGALGNVLGGLFGTSSINPLSLDEPALNIGGSIPTSMSVTPITAALAGGGPVVGGKNYLVGEQGPEIFSPDLSGRIIANDQIPMSKGTIVNQNITIPAGVDLMTRTEGVRLAGAIKQSTLEAVRDQGRRAPGR